MPVIDGRELTSLIHDFERRAGMETGDTSYGGLIPAHFDFGPLDLHFLGASRHREAGKVPLLGCSCGEWGCWPLLARVIVTEAGVTWTEFQQPYRAERDYAGFGPFSFELRHYKSELATLLGAVGRTR